MTKVGLYTIVLALSTIAIPARANEIAPIDLVFKAYQGHFIKQGIPSGGYFLQKARLGQIDAKTLIESAIEKQRLSSETIKDKNYIKKTELALFTIERRR